jgi:hypothetical protein
VDEWKRRNEGKAFSASGSRKHLLSGLLRCGRIRVDGSMCNRSMAGALRTNQSGMVTVNYRCPGKVAGPAISPTLPAGCWNCAPAMHREPSATTRFSPLRRCWRPASAKSRPSWRKTPARTGRLARSKSAGEVRRESEARNLAVRRAILSRYLQAIVVRKSSVHGPGELDYSAIEPIWKGSGQTAPSARDHTQHAQTAKCPGHRLLRRRGICDQTAFPACSSGSSGNSSSSSMPAHCRGVIFGARATCQASHCSRGNPMTRRLSMSTSTARPAAYTCRLARRGWT